MRVGSVEAIRSRSSFSAMRIDVVGRHHGADQRIGEDVREGEAARAFVASAAGERIHRFLSCRDRDFKS